MGEITKIKRGTKWDSIMNFIEDPDFYYLIGLICTDGNISYPSPGLKSKNYAAFINMHRDDKQILLDIQSKFGGNVADMKADKCTRWGISNKRFIEFLISAGITHNKSKTLDVCKFFKELPIQFAYAFLRGVIDGDGSVKKYGKYNRVLLFSGCAEIFMEMIQQFISNHFLIYQKILRYPYKTKKGKEGVNMMLMYHCTHARKILDAIYSVPGICMSRKFNAYVEHIKDYVNTHNKITE